MTFIGSEHFLDNYLWIILLIIFIAIRIFCPAFRKSGIIHSSSYNLHPWDESKDPEFFIHITDVHIDASHPSTNEHFINSLQNSHDFHANTLVITGDLCRGWGEKTFFRTGDQRLDDWIKYKEISQTFYPDFTHVFDQVGNHDEWNIWRINSENHNYPKYAYHPCFNHPFSTESEFWAITQETDDFIFLFLQPFHYPMTRAKFDTIVRETPEMLDVISDSIDTISEIRQSTNKPFFIFCHFPLALWNNRVISSHGHTITDIISSSGCNMYISGHSHPKFPAFNHWNGIVEAIGTDSLVHSSYNIVAIDNSRTSYHSFKSSVQNCQEKFIMTHPVPYDQISKNCIFSEHKTAVRVLAFNVGNSAHLNCQIFDSKKNCVVNSDLSFSRNIKPKIEDMRINEAEMQLQDLDGVNDIALYSLPINLTDGEYEIKISGDWCKVEHFVIGEKVNSHFERRYSEERIKYALLTACVIVMIVLTFILFPVDFGNLDKCQTPKWEHLFGGILKTRHNLQATPLYVRMILLISVLIPFICPMAIFEVEGHYGPVFMWGFICDHRLYKDLWMPMINGLYEIAVPMCATCFASGCAIIPRGNQWIFMDALMVVFPIASLFVGIKALCEMCGLKKALLSIFTWNYFLDFITLIAYRFKSGPSIV